MRNSLPEVLTLLRGFDLIGCRPRDILMLAAIADNPGISSNLLYQKIGQVSRTTTVFGLKRLLDWGLIEDRRNKAKKAHSSFFYVTESGEAALADLWNIHNLARKDYDL